jgi:hypothetical protein
MYAVEFHYIHPKFEYTKLRNCFIGGVQVQPQWHSTQRNQ